MGGVASLLDDTHSALVRGIWTELERDFDVRGVAISPFPHFTYHAARKYDFDLLAETLQRIAGKSRPLKARTAGIGVFPAERPVVFVPVVKSPELNNFQLALWSAAALATDEPDENYHPARWVPHITLAVADVTRANVGGIVSSLAERDLSWEMEIDNLAIIAGAGHKPQELAERFELGGGTARNF